MKVKFDSYLFPKSIVVQVILLVSEFLIVVHKLLSLNITWVLCNWVLVSTVAGSGWWLWVHHVMLSMSASDGLNMTLTNTVHGTCLQLTLRLCSHISLIYRQLVPIELSIVLLWWGSLSRWSRLVHL